jgi:hypothetical protein
MREALSQHPLSMAQNDVVSVEIRFLLLRLLVEISLRIPWAEGPKGHGVCWIAVTNIDALYQQYLPTNAVQSVPEAKPWGLKEFFLRDPFGNLLLFAERIPEEDASSEPREEVAE